MKEETKQNLKLVALLVYILFCVFIICQQTYQLGKMQAKLDILESKNLSDAEALKCHAEIK